MPRSIEWVRYIDPQTGSLFWWHHLDTPPDHGIPLTRAQSEEIDARRLAERKPCPECKRRNIDKDIVRGLHG